MLDSHEKKLILEARRARTSRLGAASRACAAAISGVKADLGGLFRELQAAADEEERNYAPGEERAMTKLAARVARANNVTKELERALNDAGADIDKLGKKGTHVVGDPNDRHYDEVLERALAKIERVYTLMLNLRRDVAGIRSDMAAIDKRFSAKQKKR